MAWMMELASLIFLTDADLPTYEKIYVSNLRSRLGLERAKYVIFQAWAFLRLRVIAFCAGERVNPFNCGCTRKIRVSWKVC